MGIMYLQYLLLPMLHSTEKNELHTVQFCMTVNLFHNVNNFSVVAKCASEMYMCKTSRFTVTNGVNHRRRLHRGNRELRPGTYARTGATLRFAPVPFMAVL